MRATGLAPGVEDKFGPAVKRGGERLDHVPYRVTPRKLPIPIRRIQDKAAYKSPV